MIWKLMTYFGVHLRKNILTLLLKLHILQLIKNIEGKD